MKKQSFAAFSALICVCAALAQAPQGPPKPGPELKRLSYFQGTWKVEGTMQPGPAGPGGSMMSTDKASMDMGGFFLVTHSDLSGGGMSGKEISFMGYDTEKKQYTYDAYNSMGEADHATGSVKGKVWSWKSESSMGGKPMSMRGTITEDSPTQYSLKFESSTDGGKTWAPAFEATATKQTSAAAAGAKKP